MIALQMFLCFLHCTLFGGISMQEILKDLPCDESVQYTLLEKIRKHNTMLVELQVHMDIMASQINQLMREERFVSCEPGWVKFRQSCYYFSEEVGNWSYGKVQCERLHEKSKYARITSQEEDTFLRNYASSQNLSLAGNPSPNDSPDYWIGGTDSQAEGNFVWQGYSQPFTYTNWGQNNPDDKNGNQDCVILFQRAQYLWHDTECGNRNRYICEM